MSAWLGAAGALLSIILLVLKLWADAAPRRRRRHRRKHNAEIDRRVRGGDVDWVRRELERMRAEDD
jgi:hypothetical protein